MNPLFTFTITCVISFIGSMQPGPLNLTVLYHSRLGGRRNGLLTAFGAVIPETIYACIAIFFAEQIMRHPGISDLIRSVSVLIFLTAGLYILFSGTAEDRHWSGRRTFFDGFNAALTNPQLILFWTGVSTIMTGYKILMPGDIISILTFIAGAVAGTFLLSLCVIYLSGKVSYLREKINHIHLRKITGWSFVILALVNLFSQL